VCVYIYIYIYIYMHSTHMRAITEFVVVVHANVVLTRLLFRVYFDN